MNEVKHISLTARCLGREITAEAIQYPRGVHVSIYGGDLPHIGAITAVSPEGDIQTTEFPAHRDRAISEHWAKALAGIGRLPVLVSAGVHYDGLSADGIREVLQVSDELLRRFLHTL